MDKQKILEIYNLAQSIRFREDYRFKENRRLLSVNQMQGLAAEITAIVVKDIFTQWSENGND